MTGHAPSCLALINAKASVDATNIVAALESADTELQQAVCGASKLPRDLDGVFTADTPDKRRHTGSKER